MAIAMALRAKQRSLRCSFCSRSEKIVAKLLGGPRAYICDACVGVCETILHGLPPAFAGWDAMSDDALLAALAPANASVEATRTVLQTQVDALRERGVTWAAIGTALGISRQAAWERFA